MKRSLPYIALIFAMLCWSVSGIATKHALALLPPFTMIIFRFTPAVLLMLVIGLVCRQSTLLRLQRVDAKDLPLFILAGVCLPFVYYLLETFTYRALNSPTVAEALLSTSPLLSPVFARFILRERITRNNIWGIVISTVGMFMLILVGSSTFAIGSYWGVLLAFASVSAAVTYAVIMRGLPPKYSPLTITFYTQLVSLMLFVPLWFWREGVQALQVLDWSELTIPCTPLFTAMRSVGYLSVFASVVAYLCYCYSVRKIGVTKANAFNNIRPAFTALWMLLFFGEHMPLAKWIGILLIIIGLFVCQKEEKRAKS